MGSGDNPAMNKGQIVCICPDGQSKSSPTPISNGVSRFDIYFTIALC